MPVFTIGVPIETDSATVVVDFSDAEPLMPGRHTFQLVVEDNDQLASKPATFEIIVRDLRGPTAVLDGPSETPYGQAFELRADRSSDPFPGNIVKYTWMRLSGPPLISPRTPVRPREPIPRPPAPPPEL